MDITGKKIWQVAAGDTNRNYADLCLDWDIIMNGPGSEGAWPECEIHLREQWELSSRKTSDLRRFAEEMADGDYVVLRIGTKDILGFGFVVGDYSWNEEFGDIDGWDLQHVRRVKWLWKYDGTPKRFDTYSLKLGDTVQLLDSQPVTDWINGLSVDKSLTERSLIKLPLPSNDVDWKEVAEYLFDFGVSSNAIEHLTNEIGELIRISKWYQRTGGPSESETVAYLAIPLLRSLGWTPQKMAIEWCGVDMALFSTLPRADNNLTVVVEAKQKDYSCLNAQSQAKTYAEQEGRTNCNRLIVTDGLRYGVYIKQDGTFSDKPHAYLNLTRMRDEYPLLKCKGAKEAFLFMSSDWVPSTMKIQL
jgi:hypothetical protein